jgi:metal-responsive CopG/Arc/MetJ family transcriptional regulator
MCYFGLLPMMPKKPDAQKRKPTGVSLKAELLRKAKVHAKRHGYASLSALITNLLRQAVEQAQGAGQTQIKKAQGKLRRR